MTTEKNTNNYRKMAEFVIKEIRGTIERGRLDGDALVTVQKFWLQNTESSCLLAGLAKVAASGSDIELATAAMQKQIDSLRADMTRAEGNIGMVNKKANGTVEDVKAIKKRLGDK